MARAHGAPGVAGRAASRGRAAALAPPRPAQRARGSFLCRNVPRAPGADARLRVRGVRRASQTLYGGEGAGGRLAVKVVVVGGGLAGLTAALDLADAGETVTVLEARPTLGGAVQTLPEREGDPPPAPDNGQHISLGCCSAYLAFLDRIGSAAGVSREPLELTVIDERGVQSAIRPGLIGLLRYRHLSLRDRLAVARVSRRLAKLAPDDHDGESFGTL